MSRELWLLRHGKSDRDLAVDDFDRPLKKRGKHDLLCLAKWMSNNNLIPDYILSSPANRAFSTANIIHGEVANSLLIAIDRRRDQGKVCKVRCFRRGGYPGIGEDCLWTRHQQQQS